MSELSRYIYSVIPASVRAGISSNGLQVIVHEDIAAVVSQSRPVDITRMRNDALAQLLVNHQKTIETVMQSVTTVIPFRLGTCAGSDQEVREILAKGQPLIRRIFSETGGKIEMDVVAVWADFAAVLKAIGEEEEIKKCKTALAANPRGVSVDDQMKIGALIKQALDCKRNDISRQIIERLAAVSGAQSRHETMNDQMIMNSAFLIEAKRQPEWERILDELNNRYAEKINFRCVGPLPPYSFYTLELKNILWEDVDWARRILGLGDAASAGDVRKAFQQSALATHPDRRAQTADAEGAFNDLGRARSIVLEYALACEQTATTSQLIFSEESVRQNSLLVKVRNGGTM